LKRAPNKVEQCRVRSGTDDPCLRPAVVKIGNIPFCEGCAREQEAYFAIGELTDDPHRPGRDESLVGMLERMRQIRRKKRRVANDPEPDAA
jgi:hypothetical protein